MVDATQHQSSQALLHHLDPYLKKMISESDFAKAQPFLFGEDFGLKVKEKLDAAATLKKVVYQQLAKGKSNFQGGYPRKHSRGRGGGHHNSYGPGKYNQNKTGGTTSEKRDK